jgi:hypothetical protein
MKYVAQFTQTVDEPEIQRLSLGLVDVLKTHLPLAA